MDKLNLVDRTNGRTRYESLTNSMNFICIIFYEFYELGLRVETNELGLNEGSNESYELGLNDESNESYRSASYMNSRCICFSERSEEESTVPDIFICIYNYQGVPTTTARNSMLLLLSESLPFQL